MTNSEQGQLLEIYKLQAELADRVSQRREGANRLYVSMHVGLVALIAALFRFGFGDVSKCLVLGAIGVVGVLMSVSWFVVIRSYRQLNYEKFRVLMDLEKRLPYRFFTLEWDPSSEGNKSNRYWKLTYVEVTLPVIFCVLFLGLITYSLFFS